MEQPIKKSLMGDFPYTYQIKFLKTGLRNEKSGFRAYAA
jgi:hypothetical protein